MKKRISVTALVLALAVLLCSCAGYAPVKVNGVSVSKGVYNYFKNTAESESKSADSLLSEYVAVNSEFNNRGLTLDAGEKAELKNTVENQWHLFSDYYGKAKVSKQDLYKIELNRVCRKALMVNYYGSDGEKPVTDEQLKEYFNANFIAFRVVTGFLTTVDAEGNTVSMSDSEKQEVIDIFKKMADDINSGEGSIDSVSTYTDSAVMTENIKVIDADSGDYPKGFFDVVKEMGDGTALSFTIGEYVFTVQKFSISSDENNLFEQYRTQCLTALKGEEFEKIVASWSSKYTVGK